MAGADASRERWGRALRRHRVWLIPAAFTLVVGVVGGSSYRALEADAKSALREQLQTLLRADVTALEIWLEMQQSVGRDAAADPRVAEPFAALVALTREDPDPRAALLAAPEREALGRALAPVIEAHGYLGFAAIDASRRMLANPFDAFVGRTLPGGRPRVARALERALDGEVVVTRLPRLEDPESLTLATLSPVRDSGGRVIGALGFRMQADKDFTRILSVAQMGKTGETYAFNQDGLMLSESRFDDQLADFAEQTGARVTGSEVRSAMHVQLRDPGGDLRSGFVPESPNLRGRPLTRMAASAVDGESGVDVDGYRDYRGVQVVGAWTWLPDLEMGVATEIDVEEAFAGLRADRRRFAATMALLGLGTIGMLLYSLVVVRMGRTVENALRLGSYHIEHKIGEGGMGKVYLARHRLLRRPTAIKLIEVGDPDSKSETAQRFEREVQVTSQLSHPNTIAVYDYGHTPEGVFYYAMEYLEGVTLSRLVDEDGAQPPERVVHIMSQVCGSIAEAHAAGLTHRDLKPANVMLCERGRVLDFAKVLDFGLVREQTSDVHLTREGALTGTPLYISPEQIESPKDVDARSDIYQLGAVAYYLLTGRHVFVGDSMIDVLARHLNEAAEPPSRVLGHPVPADLEKLILTCLAKDRDERPQSAAVLLESLEACECAGRWSQSDARAWWDRWTSVHPTPEAPVGETSLSEQQIDLAERS